MGAHGGEPARRPGGFAIRLHKNVLTYLGFADLQSAASKNAVAGLGLTTPRFSLKKTESLHFCLFRLSEAFLIWFSRKWEGKTEKTEFTT